jgi:uncharacterized membrane protein YesL
MMRMPSLIPEPGSLFDRITTVVLANMLWVVFALLIIPLPAATAGLFAVLAPLVRNRDSEMFATFFGTMRRQWLKSTVIVVADGAIGGLLVLNFRLLNVIEPEQTLLWILRSVYAFIGIAVLMVNLYLWPLLVLFDLRLRRLVSVSFRLAFGHPAWSLLSIGMAALPFALAVIVPPALSIAIVVSLVALIVNWTAWQVIRRYATPEELAELNQS